MYFPKIITGEKVVEKVIEVGLKKIVVFEGNTNNLHSDLSEYEGFLCEVIIDTSIDSEVGGSGVYTLTATIPRRLDNGHGINSLCGFEHNFAWRNIYGYHIYNKKSGVGSAYNRAIKKITVFN